MALTKGDYDFLNGITGEFKRSFFMLVSEFGSDYQANYVITLSNIKENTGRERITDVTISDYIEYLKFCGFWPERNQYGISVHIDARNMNIVANDAIQLSNAIEIYRTRAAINGNVDKL